MSETAAQSALAIDVSGLVKRFNGVTAVDGFSIQVRRGEIFGFLGPNGSGKTTTIRMLCGLLTPDAGSGTCLGFDVIRETAAIKRRVGYMTQSFSLYEDLSIEENLVFVARIYGMRGRVLRQGVTATLEQLGLADRRHQLAGALSGGWKQRLALAATMLHAPDLLLLDEPTAGVDPKARREFWDEIHAHARSGLTVLVSTHYMDEAERCHRIAYLNAGRLLASGTTADVIAATGLTTWVVTGPGIERLAKALSGLAGVDMVTVFGASLHVSSRDAAVLEGATAPYRSQPGMRWRRGEPTLEDAFIALMDERRAAA